LTIKQPAISQQQPASQQPPWHAAASQQPKHMQQHWHASASHVFGNACSEPSATISSQQHILQPTAIRSQAEQQISSAKRAAAISSHAKPSAISSTSAASSHQQPSAHLAASKP
jgi:isocitrate/isopropylmalate dehydrogenase